MTTSSNCISDQTPVPLQEISPLNLAFLGDGVYEMMVRNYLVSTHRFQPGRMHSETVKFVSAGSQYKDMEKLLPILREEEITYFNRGKNASKASVAKHASPEEYRCSTGFEAMIGWLYFTKQFERLNELMDIIIRNHQGRD